MGVCVILLLISHLSFFTSCSSIDCPVQTTVQANYALQDANGNSATLSDTLYVWTQRADGSDTLLLNRGINLTSFSLPVSYQQPEDVLIFQTVNTDLETTIDTLWLKKDDIPHFESVDCNTHFFHRLTNVRSTHQAIDTVTINHAGINYDTSKTHLNIRFKARQ